MQDPVLKYNFVYRYFDVKFYVRCFGRERRIFAIASDFRFSGTIVRLKKFMYSYSGYHKVTDSRHGVQKRFVVHMTSPPQCSNLVAQTNFNINSTFSQKLDRKKKHPSNEVKGYFTNNTTI